MEKLQIVNLLSDINFLLLPCIYYSLNNFLPLILLPSSSLIGQILLYIQKILHWLVKLALWVFAVAVAAMVNGI